MALAGEGCIECDAADAKVLSHFSLGDVRIGQHRRGLANVRRGHGGFATSPAAPRARGSQAGDGPLANEAMFELGQRAENVKHQSAAGTGGVNRLGQGPKADAPPIEVVNDVDQILQGAGQSIELPDQEGIALSEAAHTGSQFGPISKLAGDLLMEDLLAPAACEGIQLKLGVLILRADAGIANDHQTYLGFTLIYLRRFLSLRKG